VRPFPPIPSSAKLRGTGAVALVEILYMLLQPRSSPGTDHLLLYSFICIQIAIWDQVRKTGARVGKFYSLVAYVRALRLQHVDNFQIAHCGTTRAFKLVVPKSWRLQ